MALDDLLKGISVFQKGVSDLAVSQGINQANQAVMKLQQQALSEQEKMAAQNQIAQGLAGRLVAAGASAAHIEQATQRIGLTAPQQTSVDQSNKQSDIQQDQFAQEMAFKWASLRNNDGKTTNPFEMEKQKQLAKFAVNWESQEGPQLQNNLEKLQSIGAAFKDPEIKSTLSGPIRGQLPDMVRRLTNTRAIEVRDTIHSAIQDTLRPTLGAQFTAEEGERIKGYAFDEKLTPEENQKRYNLLQKSIKKKVQFGNALTQHLQKFGSDDGFNYDKWGMRKGAPSQDQEVTQQAPAGAQYFED